MWKLRFWFGRSERSEVQGEYEDIVNLAYILTIGHVSYKVFNAHGIEMKGNTWTKKSVDSTPK